MFSGQGCRALREFRPGSASCRSTGQRPAPSPGPSEIESDPPEPEPWWNPRGTLQGRPGPPRSLSGPIDPKAFSCWGTTDPDRRTHLLVDLISVFGGWACTEPIFPGGGCCLCSPRTVFSPLGRVFRQPTRGPEQNKTALGENRHLIPHWHPAKNMCLFFLPYNYPSFTCAAYTRVPRGVARDAGCEHKELRMGRSPELKVFFTHSGYNPLTSQFAPPIFLLYQTPAEQIGSPPSGAEALGPLGARHSAGGQRGEEGRGAPRRRGEGAERRKLPGQCVCGVCTEFKGVFLSFLFSV